MGETTRLQAFSADQEITWPEAEGIDTQGNCDRGWRGPYLAGTYLIVADAGRNLADDWEVCREWYHDKTEAQCIAMRDYYLAHRDLFQAQRWREELGTGDRVPMQADIRALLAELAGLRTERDALQTALIDREARVLWHLDNRGKSWALARDKDREEYREYALVSLREKGKVAAPPASVATGEEQGR